MSNWIQTYTCKKFDINNFTDFDFCIEDIAHALSNQCRFSGHVKKFYSVAQHSVLVSFNCDPVFALQGLLHDASEAYLLDIPSPFKSTSIFEEYKKKEKAVQSLIYKRFNVPIDEHPSVKDSDRKLLATEARDFMSPKHPDWNYPVEPLIHKIKPLVPTQAKKQFLLRFKELSDAG